MNSYLQACAIVIATCAAIASLILLALLVVYVAGIPSAMRRMREKEAEFDKHKETVKRKIKQGIGRID